MWRLETVEFYHSNEISINKLYLSTAEETAASEVVLDAITRQHFKCINNFYKINVLHIFLNINVEKKAMILLNMKKKHQ